MNNPMLLKPKLKIYIVMLAAAVALMIALGKCSRQYAAQQYAKSGGDTIDVAIEFAPLSLYMYEDTLGGFNYDLLRLVAKKQGIGIKFHPMTSLSESLRLLSDGIYDIVAAQVPATSEFKDKYLFTEAIFLDKQALVQKKDSAGIPPVRTQLDLARKTVCTAKGSPAVARIANLAREIGDTIFVKELDYSQEQLFLLVAAGEEDFAVINGKTAKALASDYPGIDISTAVSFNQFQSWALAKGNTGLLERLDKWLSEIRGTQEYKQLYSRYF